MIGKNTIRLNKETVTLSVQDYLNNLGFPHNFCVVGISTLKDGKQLKHEVELDSPDTGSVLAVFNNEFVVNSIQYYLNERSLKEFHEVISCEYDYSDYIILIDNKKPEANND